MSSVAINTFCFHALLTLVSGFYGYLEICINSCHSAKPYMWLLIHVVLMILPKLNSSQWVSKNHKTRHFPHELFKS